MKPMGRPFRAVAAALTAAVLALVASPCYGHGEGPGPPPPPTTPPPTVVPGGYPVLPSMQRVYPPRWSWIHWWEANRDSYLQSAKQSGAMQKADPKVVADCRARAVRALVGGLTSAAPEVRAASALALGRMGEKAAVKSLSALAAGDGSPKVRQMALLALGLLDSQESRDFLLGQRYPTDQLMEAGCIGLGTLKTANDARVITVLQEAVGTDKPGLNIASAWGLRQRPEPGCLQTLKNALSQSKSPWVASEAILALGNRADPQGLPVLINLLLAAKEAENVDAYQALTVHDAEISRAIGSTRITAQQLDTVRNAYEKHVQWREMGPNGVARSARIPGAMRVGIEKIYLSLLRGSAAIALGHYRDPAAVRALVESLAVRDDGYAQVFKGFAIMSLGEMGDPAALPPLMGYLGRTGPQGSAKSVPDLGSPLRGYAALALGLYSRPHAASLQAGDPPDYDKVCRALGERLADVDEELEVRTACAMGLGLSARTENLRYLQKAGETVRTSDDLLGGYILLARAMLGDRNIIPIAKKCLNAATEKKDTADILSRRAAVMGLAILDSQDAIPTLLEAWHLTYYVNREVAIALGLLAAYNVTDPLVKLLESSPNALEQAFAARCLAELFLEGRPCRLQGLINGNNYMLKNVRMFTYQSTANEFLYEYLIPCFGDEWI